MEIEVVDLSHGNALQLEDTFSLTKSFTLTTTSHTPSSTSSRDDIFSVASCASSHSSGQSSIELEPLASSFASIEGLATSQCDQFEFIKPCLPVQIRQSYEEVVGTYHKHPRRNTSLKSDPPTLCRQEDRKNDFIKDLVGEQYDA